MARPPIPTWFFALVVVRKGDRFLLVEETRDRDWYMPAGRVEAGESLLEAARRETLEEGGIPIVLEGILRIEHTPEKESARVRVFFVARPEDDRPPKSVADKESLGARWVTLDEARRMKLRGREVIERFEDVARGAKVAPLEILETIQ